MIAPFFSSQPDYHIQPLKLLRFISLMIIRAPVLSWILFGMLAAQPSAPNGIDRLLSTRVTPPDWGKLVFFQAFASLTEPRPPRPRPEPGSKSAPTPHRALAVDHTPIALVAKSG